MSEEPREKSLKNKVEIVLRTMGNCEKLREISEGLVEIFRRPRKID